MKRMATRRATRSASPNRSPSSISPNFPGEGHHPVPSTNTTTTSSTIDKRKLVETETSKRPLKRRNNKESNTTATANDEVTPIKNNDFCSSCGFVGRFLCCDACPKAFHFTCVDPPMDDSDVEHLEGEWYCRECEHKRQSQNYVPTPPPFPPVTALFHRMLQDLDSRNPTAYRPPIEMINYFEGVSMDKVGQYVDSSTIKPVRHKSGPQADIYDEHRLKDPDGNIIICFRCRKSALHGRMITCDYCPLSWHMDCIDPPMVSMPNPARKWMCPTHVEHVLPRMRRKRQSVIMDPVPPGGGSDAETDDDDEEESGSQKGREKQSSVDDEKSSNNNMIIEGNPMIKYNQTVYRLPYESFKLGFPRIKTLLSRISSENQDLYEQELNAPKEDIQICSEGIAEIQSVLAKFAQEDMEIPEEERSIAMLARAARMLDSGESDDDEEQQSPAEHGQDDHSHHPEPMDIGEKNDYISILRDKSKNPVWNILNDNNNDNTDANNRAG
ncbi:hypothetical protein BDA99DRAFT_228168 [Phascolomyces articulosus]|uniref:PHD-type domain-containing protein n=1 Tax=Phascolomyces articulosus TaxID=60185 RepID=A0AAD5P8P2_9FUNG|nr:hypothetical protein BDA99DRAFT_228168 [Phascolomyces articulosus]